MKVNLKIKNFIFTRTDNLYNSFKNGHILIPFLLTTENDIPVTIEKINNANLTIQGIQWNTAGINFTKIPNIYYETIVDDVIIFKNSFWSNLNQYFLFDISNPESFFNCIIDNNKTYIVMAFPVNSSGNIIPSITTANGLNLFINVDDNVTKLKLNKINLQSLPSDITNCERVIRTLSTTLIDLN